MVRMPEELIHLLTIELAVIFLIFTLIFHHLNVGASWFHGKNCKKARNNLRHSCHSHVHVVAESLREQKNGITPFYCLIILSEKIFQISLSLNSRSDIFLKKGLYSLLNSIISVISILILKG